MYFFSPCLPTWCSLAGTCLNCLAPVWLELNWSSVNHKLFVDDTQLFPSFAANVFSEKNSTHVRYNMWNFLMDGFKISVYRPCQNWISTYGLLAQFTKIHNFTLHLMLEEFRKAYTTQYSEWYCVTNNDKSQATIYQEILTIIVKDQIEHLWSNWHVKKCDLM